MTTRRQLAMTALAAGTTGDSDAAERRYRPRYQQQVAELLEQLRQQVRCLRRLEAARTYGSVAADCGQERSTRWRLADLGAGDPPRG